MLGSAFAADMPLKAVPYVPSWTGAYLGATVGWGYLDGTVTDTAAAFCTVGSGGCPADGRRRRTAAHRGRQGRL
jgi:hypothetical protein